MDPKFFASPQQWRDWLEQHHARVLELWVGFYKKASGRPSITWPESVDQALCFGWIDGVRRRIDDDRYAIRFTPRRGGSIWSSVNLARVEALTRLGLMHQAGLRAHASRQEARSGVYAYEQRRTAELPPAFLARFKQHRTAWNHFQARPPSYRRSAIWWVISAKKQETRERRLATLIADSAAGKAIKHLARPERGR